MQPLKRSQVFLIIGVLWALLSVNAIFAQQAPATILPPDFSESLFAGNISRPTAMEFAPDGRLFVAQQDGDLRVVKEGVLLTTPFLHVNVNSTGERGLLGIAFDPDFATNSYVYIYYTTSTSPIHNRVSRFTANGDVVVPGSEVVIFNLNNLSGATNHNGGAIHFGPDGRLYIGVGENATASNAQTLSNLLGKILRINKNGTIPTNNPFFNQASGNNRAIWALGLRNPFTFAFQPGTGRMFINDVGAGTWEEINDGITGSNYGWPNTEGPTSNTDFRSPLFAYRHDGTGTEGGCAINGGAFYNPDVVQFPAEYVGDYFFGDYCRRWIRHYDPVSDAAADFATDTAASLVDIKIGPDGSLYYLARGGSGTAAGVYRIEYPNCVVVPDPSPDGVSPKHNYFTSSPVTLTWNRTSWAQGYEIQVDNGAGFMSLEYQDDQLSADTLSATVDGLVECNYYWRVRAKIDNNTWGAWSAAQRFGLDLP
jgi:glucose/arabinose dehydrogenase